MINVVRSELTRMRGRGFVIGWLGLTAVMTALMNVVMFQFAADSGGGLPTDGPGVAFPTAAKLLSDEGIVSGAAAVSSILGVITLAFWAIAASTDYSTGLIRLLVSAQPRRWRLITGKWLALAIFTALTTIMAMITTVMAAPVAAQAAGFHPEAWGTNLPSILASAAMNLFASLLVWGTLGLAVATFTRSAGIAIGVGVGYVLLLESVLKAAVSSIADWLPATTINAIASGGTPGVSYETAIGLGLAYVVAAFIAALAVYTRRDITD